ncbi:MAG: hypothetical protein CM15mP1_3610 [Methanobacteriota archaeon]|nr:MAG: hypothetical protein CM15mP1_3610 [Euryarchaeota archaeon]
MHYCDRVDSNRVIEIPLPDEAGRKTILNIHLGKMSTTKLNIAKIVEQTEGFSGAELKATTVESGMIAIRDGRSKVKQVDLQLAVERIKKKKGKRMESLLHLTLCMVEYIDNVHEMPMDIFWYVRQNCRVCP